MSRRHGDCRADAADMAWRPSRARHRQLRWQSRQSGARAPETRSVIKCAFGLYFGQELLDQPHHSPVRLVGIGRILNVFLAALIDPASPHACGTREALLLLLREIDLKARFLLDPAFGHFLRGFLTFLVTLPSVRSAVGFCPLAAFTLNRSLPVVSCCCRC